LCFIEQLNRTLRSQLISPLCLLRHVITECSVEAKYWCRGCRDQSTELEDQVPLGSLGKPGKLETSISYIQQLENIDFASRKKNNQSTHVIQCHIVFM